MYQMFGPVQKTSVFMLFHIIYAVSLFGISQGQCSRDSNNRARFGPDCSFVCHCADDVQCDNTGFCPEDVPCAPRFYGPGCQIVATPYEASVTIKNKTGTYPANQLVDGNKGTCNTFKSYPDVTLVFTFTQEIYIAGLLFYTTLVPATFTLSITLVGDNQRQCTIYKGTGGSVMLECDIPIFSRLMVMWMIGPDEAVSMCEFLFFSGWSFAYGKEATQSSVDKSSKASNSVDGLLISDPNACSITDLALTSDPWWAVDMGREYVCGTVLVYSSGNEGSIFRSMMQKFRVGVSLTGLLASQLVLIYVHNGTPLKNVTNVDGGRKPFRYLKIMVPGTKQSLAICEVEVIVVCSSVGCGITCESRCNCQGLNVITNYFQRCVKCADGYRATGSGCKEECIPGTWGSDCPSSCGSCRNNATCDRKNGYCPGYVCESGFNESNPHCTISN